MTIRKRFISFIKKNKLLHKGDKILVALSGGADSAALLFLLREIKEEWNLDICLGHLNHQLRKEADKDEEFVEELAGRLKLPLYTNKKDVKKYAVENSLNLEEAGRQLRYDFLKETAFRIEANKIATAHTKSDQAETFLIRLMRGSGRKGLSGIYSEVENLIIRPLLDIKRSEIESYLGEINQEFCVDKSNYDRRFLRNKIRLDLIPLLEDQYDPQIISHLASTAHILKEEDILLESMSQKAGKKAIRLKDKKYCLDAKELALLSLALARRVVRNYIKLIRGDLRSVTFLDVNIILEMKEGNKAHLKKDLILIKENGLIFQWEGKNKKNSYNYKWRGENSLSIPEVKKTFSLHFYESQLLLQSIVFDDNKRAVLDGDNIKLPLIVRNRLEGDRYCRYGSPGRKKVKEIFRSKGIPLSQRENFPVFISGEEIVWILGFPVSDRFKITEKTKKIVVITLVDSESF